METLSQRILISTVLDSIRTQTNHKSTEPTTSDLRSSSANGGRPIRLAVDQPRIAKADATARRTGLAEPLSKTQTATTATSTERKLNPNTASAMGPRTDLNDQISCTPLRTDTSLDASELTSLLAERNRATTRAALFEWTSAVTDNFYCRPGKRQPHFPGHRTATVGFFEIGL